MRTFLELADETYVEIDLTTPAWSFSEDERRRHRAWSLGAQLIAWIGLTSFLVVVLVFSFFASVN